MLCMLDTKSGYETITTKGTDVIKGVERNEVPERRGYDGIFTGSIIINGNITLRDKFMERW